MLHVCQKCEGVGTQTIFVTARCRLSVKIHDKRETVLCTVFQKKEGRRHIQDNNSFNKS